MTIYYYNKAEPVKRRIANTPLCIWLNTKLSNFSLVNTENKLPKKKKKKGKVRMS